MAIERIQRTNVGDEVLEQIKANIISGEWLPGTKIPGELELCRLFDVSRISVRQAIHRLIGMGVLSIKRGDGTYVSQLMPSHYFESLLPMLMLERAELVEVQEFRAMMESESARLAAQRADEQDILILRDTVETLKKMKNDADKFIEADMDFHTAIAHATKNTIVIKVNSIIHDILDNTMQKTHRYTGPDIALVYHQKILEAIEAGDGERAGIAMREHIEQIIAKIKSYQE